MSAEGRADLAPAFLSRDSDLRRFRLWSSRSSPRLYGCHYDRRHRHNGPVLSDGGDPVAGLPSGPVLAVGPIGFCRVTRTWHGRVRCPAVVRIGWPDSPVCASSATHCRTGHGRRRTTRRAHFAGVRLRKSSASQGHQRYSQNDASHCSYSPLRIHSRHNGLPSIVRSDKFCWRSPRNCARRDVVAA